LTFLGRISANRLPPFLFQAGVSEAGNGFGGKHGEAIFIGGQTPEIVRVTVDNLRDIAKREGRDPGHIEVIVGINVIVAATDEEANTFAYRVLATITSGSIPS
jgi:alkanesulfonate monooxygenase SsuD/methylene tetrahydromethanopterin reductase-like flavin-dependent oxidoreductase (luciferase family)